MTETTQSPDTQGPDFDTWRDAINAVAQSGQRAYLKLRLRAAAEQVNAAFKSWLRAQCDGLPEESAGELRNALEFMHDVSAEPWNAAFATWATQSPEAKELVDAARNSSEPLNYYRLVAQFCEAYGQALAQGTEHAIISSYYNTASPDAVTYKTRLTDGTWKDLTKAELVEAMRNPNGPHILMAANHAFLESEADDLNTLADGFSTLFEQAQHAPVKRKSADEELLAPPTAKPLFRWDSESLGRDDTVMVFATNTRQNRFLNLADLFARLDEVQQGNDAYKRLSPIAGESIATLLEAMVVDEDRGKVHFRWDDAGKPQFLDAPVTLRADAQDVLRRQIYRGFSKGGNDFRDMARLLPSVLNDVRVTLPEGVDARALVQSLSVLSVASNELPLAPEHIEAGVRAPLLTSGADLLAPPPPFIHRAEDPAFNFKGDSKFFGHTLGIAVEGMLADPRARDLNRIANAACLGQAAIADLQLISADEGVDRQRLSVHLAPGTSDAMVEQQLWPKLRPLLAAQGLADVVLERDPASNSPDRYVLRSTSGEALLSPERVTALKTALRALDADAVQGVVVSDMAIDESLSRIKGALVIEQAKAAPVTIDPGKTSLLTLVNNRLIGDQGEKTHPRVARNMNLHARMARDMRQHPRITTVQAENTGPSM